MALFQCYTCKRPIEMTSAEEELLRQNQAEFHCLWGHSQYFPAGKNRAEILKEERDAALRERDMAIQRAARYQEERDTARRKEAAAKGAATKLRIRTAHGVCPCCNRTFKQLAAHMKNKHPDFLLCKKL